MSLDRFLFLLALACAASSEAVHAQTVPSHDYERLHWIWLDEGTTEHLTPASPTYFRRGFQVRRPVDQASLGVTADCRSVVWLNGTRIGAGDDCRRVYHYDVRSSFREGDNVLAVEAEGNAAAGGLLVRLMYVPNGEAQIMIPSDSTWKAATTAPAGWQTLAFDDAKWRSAKKLGPWNEIARWQGLVWDEGGDGRFAVPAGFRVEKVAQNPNSHDPFSLINLTFDASGRLLVSQEEGPILLCTQPDAHGVFQSVKPYCTQVQGCQGMCWVKDALLLVGQGPKGAGLYRVSGSSGSCAADHVELIHKFVGKMVEHGPHAILHGPDNSLYLVIGNHAWAHPVTIAANSPLTRWPQGQMGPDQGKPGSMEDVLLPRLNDPRGHAADLRAPGGTIWRLDPDGKNMSLVAAGLRNAFDAAFSPTGELFTFDSDMEWDEGLPWYRPVRACLCIPGADFLWRTGSANTPDYYIDSLPSALDIGRGSPVGMEFYQHCAFPKRYRGACFVGDWSLGLIDAAFPERQGASYRIRLERFCRGNPMNVTDVAVGPDGSLYFTMGGRHTQGGVYRIVYQGPPEPNMSPNNSPACGLDAPQPLAAWGRRRIDDHLALLQWALPGSWAEYFLQAAQDPKRAPAQRIEALDILQNHGEPPAVEVLIGLWRDHDALVRSHAVFQLGVKGGARCRTALVEALKDQDPLVRRHACEALIRAGIEPPVDVLWPILADHDHFLATAGRLVLERIDPKKWVTRLWNERDERILLQGVVALCKTDQAKTYADVIFERLRQLPETGDVQLMLDRLRALQLALIHTDSSPQALVTQAIGEQLSRLFLHADERINREIAMLLTYLRITGRLNAPLHGKLLAALTQEKNRVQQIHYFYCLRLLKEPWTAPQRWTLLRWFESMTAATGGMSYVGFLELMLRDMNGVFDASDRQMLAAHWQDYPFAAATLIQRAPPEQLPAPEVLVQAYEELRRAKNCTKAKELKEALFSALGSHPQGAARHALRRLGDQYPAERDFICRALAKQPAPENFLYYVRGLQSSNPLVVFDATEALLQVSAKPKPDDPEPYRRLLEAAGRLPTASRWKAVLLLRNWHNNQQFGGDEGDWQIELSAWTKWFSQCFPREPRLVSSVAATATPSRYSFEELCMYLETNQHAGDKARGRLVFEKAQCIKCHRFGSLGEGIGPDLTTVSKRFQRRDILESIVYPSKTISDQYRSTTILTKKGLRLDGLAAPQGDCISLLQSDGSKLTVARSDVEQQFASLVSVMPERLLDALTKQEIADLFVFLESDFK
jgi:putative heme-binding domain-containing protein